MLTLPAMANAFPADDDITAKQSGETSSRLLPFTRPGEWPEAISQARFAKGVERSDHAGCTLCLIGLPDDLGVKLNNGRQGASDGPRAFRAALAGYGVAEPAGVEYPRVFDGGDVMPAAGNDAGALDETHFRVSAASEAAVMAGMFPVGIGGGHDLTFAFVRGVIRGMARREKGEGLGGKHTITSWRGVYADAHLDVRETAGSGMPFRKLIEECGVRGLGLVGFEEQVNLRDHYNWFVAHGGELRGAYDSITVEPGEGLFVSIDMDCMASAFAPGVSAPRAGGLTPRDVRALLRNVAHLEGVSCLDFMELCPRYDVDGRTARLAASLFLEFAGVWEGERRRRNATISSENDYVVSHGHKLTASSVTIINARVLTCVPAGCGAGRAARGGMMNDLGVIEGGSIRMEGGVITYVGPGDVSNTATSGRVIDAGGRVVMPAFVDCHTHACFAGNRLDEWALRLAGTPYLDILARGGGIMSSVRSVRGATEPELRDLIVSRFRAAQAQEGTGLMEVKSGYGLTTESELMMLRAIRGAALEVGGEIVPTALLGHAVDSHRPGFIDYVINDTLPAVSAEFPGICIDAYCENGAWMPEDCLRLFARARELGHPCRVHSDQFHDLGFAQRAAELGFVSIDHLEASTPETLEAIAKSESIAVGLPIVELHMGTGRYPQLHKIVSGGGAVALASNFNPGTAWSYSLPLAVALAVRFCGLTVAQAIMAATRNAACVVGVKTRGVIAVGGAADVLVLEHTDERMLAYQLGGNHIHTRVRG
jgi:imidazolonepropionase